MAAARAAISEMVTAPSPGSPTPLLAAEPRPPPPRPGGAAAGNAVAVGRVKPAVLPPGQPGVLDAAVEPSGFCHSMRPRSVSMAVTLLVLPTTKANDRNPR